MDLVARINALLWTWIQSMRSVKRISLFFPFLLFAVLQVGLLLLLIFFYLPPISSLLIPLIRLLSQESALHYPQFYFYLPGLFSKINVWLNLLASWLFVGAATLMFAGKYRGRPVRTSRALGQAFRRIIPLFAVGMVEWVVIRAVMQLFGYLTTSAGQWATQSPRLFLLVGFFINIVFIVPFAYTAAEVMLGKRSIGGALRGSFALARRNYGLTYLLFAVPSLLTLAMNLIFQYAPVIVTRTSPGVMVLLMIINIVVTVVVNFAIVGSLTAFYLRAAEQG